ncbi:hypothetical protein R0G64_30515, partial [Pseudomonas otitidis]|nr:hypothetical protein [Pseudomonas otitidis]
GFIRRRVTVFSPLRMARTMGPANSIGRSRMAHLRTLGTHHTSDFVVHFQKFSESYIALVDYGSHNPMRMPGRESLFKR